MYNARLTFFVCSLALVFLAGLLHWMPWTIACKATLMLLSYGLVFFGFIGAWLSFPDGLSAIHKTGLILIVSLVARIFMAGVPESDDVYRYLWEGKLITAGESPYRYPADHAYFSAYRDAYWEGMNHKDKFTAYPPLAEWVFAAVGSLSYTPWAFKILFIIADLCVIGVLIALLRQHELDLRNALLYALNPLTLFAIAGEGHFDVLLILAMMLSVVCVEKRAFAWAWFWLGTAIQIKIVAAVLLPLYLLRCQWRYSWLMLVPLVIPSIYFAETLPGLFQGLWNFGTTHAFNGPIHGPLNYLLDGNIIRATQLIAVLWGFVTLWIIWAVSIPVKAAYLLIATLVLFSPVVHYWYILWVIPFVVLYPGLPWLVLSFTSGAYFISVFSVAQGEDWVLPVWAMWAIWLPFLLVLVYDLRTILWRRFRPDILWDKPETLAIVVPTLNEEKYIQDCLSALASMKPPPDEIVVSDGGSTDRTVAMAKAMGVSIINSRAGRGIQIRAGVEAVRSEVVLVIHADCICDQDIGQRILNVLRQNPDVAGGAIGQRFSVSSLQLLVIEMLNDARAAFGGISFGDQGQFFRVTAIKRTGGFPDYPLMEDVELSLRLMQTGRVVLLGDGICNSARQWHQGFVRHVLLVLKLVAVFRLSRLFQRDITQKLYMLYYRRK